MSCSSRTGFSDNVKASAVCPMDSKISSYFCSCLDMMFLTELQLIFLLIPIVTALLVPSALDTDSLPDPETLLESSFSSNKPLLSPGSKVSSKSGCPFSRFLTELYVPP